MKVAILDDEIHCIESLALDLHQIDEEIFVVYKSNKPEEALRHLQNISVDLLFLDIEMPGMNGFEFLDQFETLPFEVVFTTAYSQYAVQAFKFKAFNYLLKPVDETELSEVIQHWKQKKNQAAISDVDQTFRQLLDQMKKEGIFKSKIAVPILDGYEFIEINEILYCKSENNYTNFFLEDGNCLLISKTLKEVEKILEKHSFIRIHQSFLINPHFMVKYQRTDGGYVTMKNGESIRVSHQKKSLITGLFEAVKKTN